MQQPARGYERKTRCQDISHIPHSHATLGRYTNWGQHASSGGTIVNNTFQQQRGMYTPTRPAFTSQMPL